MIHHTSYAAVHEPPAVCTKCGRAMLSGFVPRDVCTECRDKPDITKLARDAGFEHFDKFPADYQGKIERLATLAIADFLARTGQYVTNEASREKAIAEAVAAEREACAQTCEALEVHDAGHPGTAFKIQGMCIDAIRARCNTDTQAVSKSS